MQWLVEIKFAVV